MDTDNATVEQVLQELVGQDVVLSDALEGVDELIGQEQMQIILGLPTRFESPHLDDTALNFIFFSGSKVLKALASEYAFLSFPQGSTALLTSVTRVLISADTFEPVLRDFIGPVMSKSTVFFPFLTLVVYAGGACITRSLLLPVLRATLHFAEYAIHLPEVMCRLLPGEAFSNLPHSDLIEMIVTELEKRDIFVSKEMEQQESSEENTNICTVTVKYGSKQESRLEKCKRIVDYYTIVVKEARNLFILRESNTDKIRKVPQLSSSLNDFKMWMHELHRLLRLQPPYKDMFHEDFSQKVRRCEGWIPLSEVYYLLKYREQKTTKLVPSEDSLRQLLEHHDLYQRFEVGICEIEGEFKGQLCARALYAHDGRLPIYECIFKRFLTVTDPENCPQYAWIPLGKSQDKERLDNCPLKLFETRFVYAFSLQTLRTFERYRREKPQEEQYDEKLSGLKDLCFMEFCLRAAVRDELMTVLQMPQRGDEAVRWLVFSNRKEGPTGGVEIPRFYFTGNVAKLRSFTDDSTQTDTSTLSEKEDCEGIIFSKREKLENVKPIGFTDDEVMQIFGSDRRHRIDDESDSGYVLTTVEKESEATDNENTVSPVPLDTSHAEAQVLAFIADSEAHITHVFFPKRQPGGKTFFNRHKTITAFKEWVLKQNLVYKTCDLPDNTLEEKFEIRKRGPWDDQFVAQMAKEMGLEDLPNLDLLRQAMTRECENKDKNYERLEFIGDAVMDFLVVFDTFLLGNFLYLDVTVKTCCNKVIAHLIPTTLSTKLSQRYTNLNPKVKADIMEGIVGAVYQSKMGLDRVRQLLRHLFRRIPCLIENSDDKDIKEALGSAKLKSPYLCEGENSLDQRYRYNCETLIDEESAIMYVSREKKPFEGGNQPHYASTPFHRVQDKLYATHFTTGSVYSYRRISSIDIPSLYNRILSKFTTGSIAFVNEIITNETHLTIDFDGAKVRSYGVLRIIWNWFSERFASRSSLLLLDCSGISVIKNKMKHSYHIHFPQAVIKLESLQNSMEDLRHYIVDQLVEMRFRGSIVDVINKEGQNVLTGRVVFCIKNVITRPPQNGENLLCNSILKFTDFLGFADLRTLLAFGQTCRAARNSVLSHLCGIAQRPNELARITGGSPRYIIAGSDNTTHYALIKVRTALSYAKDAAGKLLFSPEDKLYNATLSKQKDVFSLDYWNTIVDPALVTSKKLRMYMNDKYDMVYKQEYRPLFLDTLIHPGGEIRTMRPGKSYNHYDVMIQNVDRHIGEAQNYPCEIAHASTLKLTTLRCPEYRDVHGYLWSAWSQDWNTDTSFTSLSSIDKTNDCLPSFEACQAKPPLQGNDWGVWLTAICCMQRGDVDQVRQSELAKTMALQPAYWTFDASRLQAQLWISGEIVLLVGPSPSLINALTEMRGMVTMARHLVPSTSMEGVSFNLKMIKTYSTNMLPLFHMQQKKETKQNMNISTFPITTINTNSVDGGDVFGVLAPGTTTMNTDGVGEGDVFGVLAPGTTTMNTDGVGEGDVFGVLAPGTTTMNTDGVGEDSTVTRLNEGDPSETLVVRNGEKVPELLHGLYEGSSLVIGRICAAVFSVFRGHYFPSLYVTTNKEAFKVLLCHFQFVVTPHYLKPNVVERLRTSSRRRFRFIIIIDDTTKPYENKQLVKEIWNSLDECGKIYTCSVALQQALMS